MKATTGNDIDHAAELLAVGELVAIPTETVYGLAGNAFSPEAVVKIFEVKNRPAFNPLIVHAGNTEMISRFTDHNELLLSVAEKFWPGPLTILLPKKKNIPDLVTAGSDFVAVRIPSHPLTLELLRKIEFPLAAPSANPFGSISPTTAQHVKKQLGNKIPYILDGGRCDVGVESTIIKENNGKIEILRSGGIPAEELAEIIGYLPDTKNHSSQPEAPGMLTAHYAPTIPLYFGDPEVLLKKYNGKKIALLSFAERYASPDITEAIILSENKDLREAARNLFQSLHTLDASGADVIIAEELPETGLGRAINDRLRRASAGSRKN